MSPCVVTGLRLAVRALTNPGDGVLITTPVYGPFFAAVRGNEHPLVESPMIMDENNRFTLNLADIEEKLAACGDCEEEDEYLTHDSFNFHTQSGYSKVAHMKTIGKKFDRWYDLLWMQKKL